MRTLLPAAMLAAAVLLVSSLWEFLRLAWLQSTMIGVAGSSALLSWQGPGMDGSGWWAWVVLPAVLGALLVPATLVATRVDLGRPALGLLGVGAVAHGIWTVLVGLLGLGFVIDAQVHGSVLFLTYPHVSPWEAWGRWVFDGTILLALAVLLGFGPRSPSARRAVFVGLLTLGIDQLWRIAVTVLSGSVPFLWSGLGPLDAVATLVWVALGALGIGFLGALGNLPGADGPPRRGLLVGLGLAGVIFGLEGSALYALGLLHALGFDIDVELGMPLYPGLLGLYRLGLLAVGALAVGLGRYREIPVHTAVPED